MFSKQITYSYHIGNILWKKSTLYLFEEKKVHILNNLCIQIIFLIIFCIICVWPLFCLVRVNYKSTVSTYSFGKTRFSCFCVLFFHVSISLGLSFYFFCSIFWIQCHLERLKQHFLILFSLCSNDFLIQRYYYEKHVPGKFVSKQKCHL